MRNLLMKNSFKYIFALTFFCTVNFLFFSCTKEPENTIPVVIIESPSWNQMITIPDTIKVSGSVDGNSEIESIKIDLVNSDFIPVQSPLYYYPNPVSEKTEFELFYPIEKFNLDSDIYYIHVRATNKEGSKNKYQSVVLNENIPQLEKVIVITQPNISTSNIYELNLSYHKHFLFSIEGKYQASDISSYYKQLYFARNIPGKLQTYNLNTNEIEWEYNAGFPFPSFTDVFYKNDRIYISSENGDIVGLNTSAQIKFNTPVLNDTFPEKIYKHQDFMIADLKIRTGNDKILAIFYMASGNIKSTYISNFDVVEFYYFDDDNVLIFANYEEQAVLKFFNISGNYCSELLSLPDGRLKAVERFNNEYLFCIGENIYKYFILSNTVFPYLTGNSCNLILNNYFNNEVFFVNNNKIDIYNYSLGTYMQDMVFDNKILDIHLLHN